MAQLRSKSFAVNPSPSKKRHTVAEDVNDELVAEDVNDELVADDVSNAKPSASSQFNPADEAKKGKKKGGKRKQPADEAKKGKKKGGKRKQPADEAKKGKKKGQQLVDEEVIRTSGRSWSVRATPKPLCNVLNSLKEQQKNVLRDMGFGSLLEMKIDELNGPLGCFVVNNFDASELVLQLSSGPPININRQSVHDMLGIPMGDTDLLSLQEKEIINGEESLHKRWKSQFGGKSIRPKQLSSVILNSGDTGIFFKLNFLMLFVTTMMVCDTAGACTLASQMTIIDRLSEDTEFQNIDWCGLLIHYLKKCKDNWPPKENGEYHFTGPMTFLQLLYLDSTRFEKFPILRQRPAIKYWNTTYLNERVAVELAANRVFGELPLQPAFSESNCHEEYHSILEGLFTKILADKIHLESTLKSGLSIFPKDVKLLEFNDKFQQLFRENADENVNVDDADDAEERENADENVNVDDADDADENADENVNVDDADDAEERETADENVNVDDADDADENVTVDDADENVNFEDEDDQIDDKADARKSSRERRQASRYTPAEVKTKKQAGNEKKRRYD